MKKKVMKDDFEPTDEQRELADKAYQKALEVVNKVTPTRVVIASIFMAALMFSIFALGFWVVPRDSVSVDVVYKQGSSEAMWYYLKFTILEAEEFTQCRSGCNLHQCGWRGAQFNQFWSDFHDGAYIDAGDDLEIIITGASIWEQYFIEVELDYDSSCCGPVSKHVWTIEVENIPFESHRLDLKETGSKRHRRCRQEQGR